MTENRVLQPGSLFMLTYGEFSDYEMITLCKATKRIEIDALREAYLQLYPAQQKDYCFEKSQFVKWLIVDMEVCEEVDCFEWHIGEYGLPRFELKKTQQEENEE